MSDSEPTNGTHSYSANLARRHEALLRDVSRRQEVTDMRVATMDAKLFGGDRPSEGDGVIGDIKSDIAGIPAAVEEMIERRFRHQLHTQLMALVGLAGTLIVGIGAEVVHWVASGHP
jgi:hypothetical protein